MITFEDLEAAGFKAVPNIKLGIDEPTEIYRHPGWSPVPEIYVMHEPWYAKAGSQQKYLRAKEDLDSFIDKMVKRFCEPK